MMSSVLTLKPNLRWCPPNYKGNLISTWEQPQVRGMCVKSHLRVLYGAVQHKPNTVLLWMRVGTSNASSKEMVSLIVLRFVFWRSYSGLFGGTFSLKINKSLLKQEFGGWKKGDYNRKERNEGNEKKKKKKKKSWNIKRRQSNLILSCESFCPKQ